MGNNLTISQIKAIYKEIIDEERKKNNTDTKKTLLTIAEYYKSDIFKKKLKLTQPRQSLRAILSPLINSGISYENEILVFINEKKINCTKYSLATLIFTTYHELRHDYQYKDVFPKNHLVAFLMGLEAMYRTSIEGEINYRAEHNQYLVEIDANLQGIYNTEKYLQKYPELYKKNKNYIEDRKRKYKTDKNNYNPYKTFENFNSLMQKKSKEIFECMPILHNFYNKNGTFKSFSEILSNKNNLEHEIIDFIITSNAFLKQVDYERLTELEKFKLVKILNEGYENIKEATTLTPRKVPSKKNFQKTLIWLNQFNEKKYLNIQKEHLETIKKILAENNIPKKR